MKWFSRPTVIAILILPALALYVVYDVIPIFVAGYYSLTDYYGLGAYHYIGLSNYVQLFTDRFFLNSLKNTLLVLVTNIVLLLPLSLLLALLLHRPFRLNSAIRALNFSPYIIAPIVAGLIWYFVLDPHLGLVNLVLRQIGLSALAGQWIGGQVLTPYSVGVVETWRVLGFYATIFLAGLTTIPEEIYDSGRIDGVNKWQEVTRLTIPMLRETITIIVVLAITGVFRIFETVYELTGGGPVHVSDVLVTYMYNTTFRLSEYGYGMSIAVVSFVISAVFSLGYVVIAVRRGRQPAAAGRPRAVPR